jgi:RNA polymerase sigma factor (TIGR02999 family)
MSKTDRADLDLRVLPPRAHAVFAFSNDFHHPALAEQVALVYDELRALAARQMRREPRGHTLQATALVHEAYLRIAGQSRPLPRKRLEFFAVAATAMRRVLVDHARSKMRKKRGGDHLRVTLAEDFAAREQGFEDVLALDDLLDKLAKSDERLARVLELRMFAGLEIAEIAEVLGLAPRAVDEELSTGRAWMLKELARIQR